MDALISLAHWLAGNGKYMSLTHCMGHDAFWIAATVALDLAVALGYALIAVHWWRNARLLPPVPAKSALGNIRNVFVFCGICGYLFIPIKMVWPAWRLYDIFLAVLVFYTWRYAAKARDLKVVYSAIGQTTKLQGQLEEESRGKALFLNAISHDLRTPLNGLVLQMDLAEMNLNDPESLKRTLKDMRASVATAAGLLDSLLDFSRVDWAERDNRITCFRLDSFLREALDANKSVAHAKGLSLTTSGCDSIHLRCDHGKLERILNNLIANALKFTTRGGVRVEAEHCEKGAEIHVIDTGCGIAPEHHERLFDDFFQVGNPGRDRGQGFGLGLSISRRLARQLGGDLVVDSDPGRGSRFSVLLPSAVVPAPIAAAAADRVGPLLSG